MWLGFQRVDIQPVVIRIPKLLRVMQDLGAPVVTLFPFHFGFFYGS